MCVCPQHASPAPAASTPFPSSNQPSPFHLHPHDAPTHRFIESNYVFISGIGYLVAMALQALDVRTYSCAACFFYLGCVCLGLMLARARIRKVGSGVWEGGSIDVLRCGQ